MQRWMSTAKLRALFEAGMTYEDIAKANERAEGWRPTRSGVKRKLERLNFPPRRTSRDDLLPWRIAPEHHNDRFRHMLEAESRRRAGVKLSASDKSLVMILHDLLFGRGLFLVVTYDRTNGFGLAQRLDTDTDIIRAPELDQSLTEQGD